MEVVEIIVYIGVAFVIGGLIIGLIAGWDVSSTYEGITNIFRGSPADQYEEITAEQLPHVVLEVWDACGFGTTALNKTVLVTNDTVLTKADLFIIVKAAALCKTMQSAANGCGTREDVVFPDVTTPAVLRLSCDPTTAQLRIES